MKKYLVILLFAFSTSCVFAQGTLDVLLTGATEEPNVSDGVQESVRLAEYNMEEVAKTIGFTFQIEKVVGSQFTKNNVVKAIEAFKQKKAQGTHIKIWLNVSHGVNFRNAISALPYLVVKPHSRDITGEHDADLLSLKDAFEALKASASHVHIFNESCNNAPSSMINPATRKDLTALANGNGLLTLLTSARATIITSSSYDEKSYVTSQGGFFMNALADALTGVHEGLVKPSFSDAQGFFEFAKRTTNSNTKGAQTPIYFIENVPAFQPQTNSQGQARGNFKSNNMTDIIKKNTTDVNIKPQTHTKGESGAIFKRKKDL